MAKSDEKTSRWYDSTVMVTVIGFLLTGLIGGFLTYYWHKKEYTYKARLEQEYARIQAHQKAWESLYNRIFDQTSEYIVVVGGVISIYEYSISNVQQQKLIIEDYNRVSNDWFKNAIVIRSQLRLLFIDQESSAALASIEEEWCKLMDESQALHQHIGNLATRYRVKDKSSALTREFHTCQKHLEHFEDTVYTFGNNLIAAIFAE
jgi:hypothetical protein